LDNEGIRFASDNDRNDVSETTVGRVEGWTDMTELKTLKGTTM
jgi:hypothetical protein